jgi:DHA3 family macrolide efflux protein-like MFS transporter
MSSFFRNRFVQAIILSTLFVQVGTWVRNFAILLYVTEKTNNDPLAVSLISVAEFAPIFLFSFIGGAFADRWRPKRTMIWSDILSAISVFAVLATLLSGIWQAIFFATLFSAILSQFSQPSGLKLFKQHVPGEQLQMGMALFQSLIALFLIVGPVLGTFVYQNFGINVSIAVMGVAFLVSATFLTLLPPDRSEEEAKQQSTLLQEMKEGIQYVLKRPILKQLGGCFMAAGAAVGLIQPLGIFIVVERLGMPKEFLQWYMAVTGAGMLVGGGLAMGLAKKMPPVKMLLTGMLISTVAVALTGWSTNWMLTLVVQFLSSLFMPMIHIGINTIMLQTTEEAYIGRVNGILNPLFMGMMVLFMSVSGALKMALSLVAVFEIAAVLFLVGMLFILPLLKHKPQEQATVN